jgi:hypothetical protein
MVTHGRNKAYIRNFSLAPWLTFSFSRQWMISMRLASPFYNYLTLSIQLSLSFSKSFNLATKLPFSSSSSLTFFIIYFKTSSPLAQVGLSFHVKNLYTAFVCMLKKINNSPLQEILQS